MNAIHVAGYAFSKTSYFEDMVKEFLNSLVCSFNT